MTYGKCKGFCDSPEFKKKFVASKKDHPDGYYKDGCTRCKICSVYILPGIDPCPCCNGALRKRPRMKRDRLLPMVRRY